jgi:hypothetical protein
MYRLVDGPRLQQRSEKRQPTMPARRKIAEVTRNPIADFPAGALRGRLWELRLRRIDGQGGSPDPGGGGRNAGGGEDGTGGG